MGAEDVGRVATRQGLPRVGAASWADPVVDVCRVLRGRLQPGGRPGRSRGRQGGQGPHPLGELPRDGAGLVCLRHPGGGGCDHQHPLGPGRTGVLHPEDRLRGRGHPATVRGGGGRRRSRPGVDRGDRGRRRRGRCRRETMPAARLRPVREPVRRLRLTDPPRSRPDGTGRHLVHLGYHVTAQSSGAHPCQRAVGREDRSRQHLHGTRRHLPGLPAVLPRERPELVVLDGVGGGRERSSCNPNSPRPASGRS